MKNNNLGDFLRDIADAIREKTGISGGIPAQEFSEKILEISSGGNIEVEPKDVNFYDFDGTLLYSFTVNEFLAMQEMPTLPSHNLLTALRWTYQLEDAKSYVGKYGYLDIGAIYKPYDGKTRFHLDIPYGGATLSLKFIQSVSKGCVVDYGDGSPEETFSATSVSTSHTYQYGKYILSIEVQDGTITFYRPFADTISEYIVERIDAGDSIATRFDMFAYGRYKSIVAPRLNTYDTGIYSAAIWLRAIVIPSVSSIPNNVFAETNMLRKAIIEDGPTSMGSCFYNNQSLNTISLPESITSINGTFENCSALNTIIIPEGVKTIGARSFYGCPLKLILFLAHKSVPNLSSTNALPSSSASYKIVVPDELYSSWIQATNWSSFASNIITKSEWEAQR